VRSKALYLLMSYFFYFLPPKLIDGERTKGRPSFSYCMWGPWNSSTKIDRNFPSPPPFLQRGNKWQTVARISILLLFETPPFRTGRLFQQSKKTCQGPMVGVPKINRVGVGPPILRSIGAKGTPMGPKGKMVKSL